MAETEISFLGSCSSIGALTSIPIAGYLNDILGRKKSCVLFASLQVISWSIISSCSKVEAILAAVFVAGLSGSLILLVPIYVGEICQGSIRGMMTSSGMIFVTTGMLISYLLGGYLSYAIMNYVCLSLAVLGVVMLSLLKESPMFLMKKGVEKEAAKAVAYYRGVEVESLEVYEEMESMRKALNPEFEAPTPEEEKLKPEPEANPKKLSLYQFLKKSRSTRRALAICLFLYSVAVFQGLVVVQVYAIPLFEEAVPNMSATIASVLFALVSMVAGFIAAFLVDKLGRRPLMIYASTGACVCCVALGTQIHLHWGPHWLTPVFIYMFCLSYFCGAGSVPYVFVAEVFLPEVRSYLSVIAIEWAYICSFTILFIFNPLVAAIGLGPVFYLFAGICFISAVVSMFVMPETKGLTVDVIQTKLEEQW
ncbi:facilitated trehalose transporter Tret1-like [Epargyreus clarus]|uniref:facilitated trehalose transporter Tret1-like n=1 Tax=Epargyreus clarus TaxID=520877 RepID=UPI003C2C915F